MRRGWAAAAVVMFCSFHGDAPAASGGVCEGYTGQAGGLCNAYCEALDCDGSEGATRANPGACEDLAARFSGVTGGEPLPCGGGEPPAPGGPVVHTCLYGLVVPLMSVDTDGDGVVDDVGATVPVSCFIKDPIAGASYSINLAFWPPEPDQHALELTCEDFGYGPVLPVQVHAWLASPGEGPVTCETYLVLQDNNGYCDSGGS